MFRSLLILVVLLFHQAAFSQTLQWAKKIGGPSTEHGRKSKIDANSNVYLVGSFHGTVDFDPSGAVFNMTSNGMKDIFISKFDSLGNFIWAFSIGGTLIDDINDIELDHAGNFVITGYLRGPGVDFNPHLLHLLY